MIIGVDKRMAGRKPKAAN